MFSPNGEKTNREPEWKKSSELQKEEGNLRKIVDKNFQKSFSGQKKSRPDLIDNFHWVITRFRRMKKLTQEQLAREISELLAAIQMAEQGIVPEKDYVLIKKIENYLEIFLIKQEKKMELTRTKQRSEQQEQKTEQQDQQNNNVSMKDLKFESDAAKRLTIADLRRIKQEERDEKSFSEFSVDFEEDSEESDKKEEEEDDR